MKETTDGLGSQVNFLEISTFSKKLSSPEMGPWPYTKPVFKEEVTYHPRFNVLLTAVFTAVSFAVLHGHGNEEIFLLR